MLKKIQRNFSNKARAKRAKLFVDMLKPKTHDKILDLGGGNGKHINGILGKESFEHVVIADILSNDLAYAEENFGYKTHQLTEDETLPFGDKQFDIIFCNSVLEHVTIPKEEIWNLKNTAEFKKRSFESQSKFANEIQRIGKRFFVQTPNKYFILESHTWLPGIIAFLPRPAQIAGIKFFNKFWPKKTTPDWNLLTYNDMQTIFPDCEIYREKSLGFTKSFIAIKKEDTI
ncbi:MAG: class I SAM-dependent methyltransferase [Psychroserpens sp.]|uniref:class I SAM-dependent methyltransferase n=1 Tax=Psychroserpens sp. TaxID=2020870 RepID=UPI003C715111